MLYALLVYEAPESNEGLTEAEREAISAEYLAVWNAGHIRDGAHLSPAHTATTVRVKDTEALVTDGPFADTKEVFGGYYLVEADDLDAAIQVASQVPAARLGGSVEIRPVVARHQP